MNPLANPLASIAPLPPQQQMAASKRQGANPLLDWVGNANQQTAPMSNKMARRGNPLGDAMPMMGAEGPAAPTQGSPISGMPYGMGGQPKQDNPLGAAFGSFARGFLGPERTGQIDAQHAERENAKLTKTLTWLQQTAAQPAEQRVAFTQRFAQQIAADTGQPVEAIMASLQDPNGFSDQSIQQGIAALSAQLGMAPEQPEGYTLAPGARRYGGDGKMIAENPRSENDTPANWQRFEGEDGMLYAFNPQNPDEIRPLGIRAPKSGQDGFTLSKDQIRYGPDGRPIAYGRTDGPPDPNAPMDPERIRLEREFAKDWKSVQTNFAEIDGQFNRMEALAARGDAASDLGLIVSFTKMLDPGSVAREGEVQLTQKAASVLDNIYFWKERVEKGETLLPPHIRKQYLDAAREMYGVYAKAYQGLAKDYEASARRYSYDVPSVMMGYDKPEPSEPPPASPSPSGTGAWLKSLTGGGQPQQAPAPAAPQAQQLPPGTIDTDDDTGERYRFKGGDPTDQRNWELVR